MHLLVLVALPVIFSCAVHSSASRQGNKTSEGRVHDPKLCVFLQRTGSGHDMDATRTLAHDERILGVSRCSSDLAEDSSSSPAL